MNNNTYFKQYYGDFQMYLFPFTLHWDDYRKIDYFDSRKKYKTLHPK